MSNQITITSNRLPNHVSGNQNASLLFLAPSNQTKIMSNRSPNSVFGNQFITIKDNHPKLQIVNLTMSHMADQALY